MLIHPCSLWFAVESLREFGGFGGGRFPWNRLHIDLRPATLGNRNPDSLSVEAGAERRVLGQVVIQILPGGDAIIGRSQAPEAERTGIVGFHRARRIAARRPDLYQRSRHGIAL